ncbi:MAG: hypothetical protein AB7D06_02475 [Pedobacter sp.]
MRYILVGIFAVTLVVGCSLKSFYREGNPHEVLLNADKSISIQLPEQKGWTVLQDAVIAVDEAVSEPHLYDLSYHYAHDIVANISVIKFLSHSKLDIDFFDYPSRNPKGETMLDPTALASLEEDQKKLPNAWQIENDLETRTFGRKCWVDYVHGMKCTSVSYSRGVGGTWLPGGITKFYKTYCAYYDLQENPRVFRSSAFYFYHPGSSEETVIDGEKFGIRQSQADVEQEFKQSLAFMLRSLKIIHFNAPMMKQKGLLYDKEYEIPKW